MVILTPPLLKYDIDKVDVGTTENSNEKLRKQEQIKEKSTKIEVGGRFSCVIENDTTEPSPYLYFCRVFFDLLLFSQFFIKFFSSSDIHLIVVVFQ